MRVTLRVLASGSTGNALFIRAGGTRVLVDAGISARRIHRGLAEIDERVEDLSAVLITHEHSDHVRGLPRLLAGQPQVAVLTTMGTRRAIESSLERAGGTAPLLSWGAALESARGLALGELRVRPFPLPHDAAEPVGFRFEAGGIAFGVATDLGTATVVVERSLEGCAFLLIESNHDLDMLARGPYPPFLKRRVASRKGHLSNDQAADLLRRLAGPQLQHVVLAHLSRTNNAVEAALRSAAPALEACPGAQLEVGHPKHCGDPIELALASAASGKGQTQAVPRQLGLFD